MLMTPVKALTAAALLLARNSSYGRSEKCHVKYITTAVARDDELPDDETPEAVIGHMILGEHAAVFATKRETVLPPHGARCFYRF